MTPAPLSRTQIEKLGVRLVERTPPAPIDLAALHELLSAYGEILDIAVNQVRDELDVAPTARIKNTGTILEKLHRYGGSWLKSLHDLAGMRIVGNFNRDGQDDLVAKVVDLFASGTRSPRVIDRRAEPVQGYRAVHVVVYPGGFPVEIQVRTRLQHEWAEIFEKLADRVGRGIRYGELPHHWRDPAQRDELYEATFRLREVTVQLALVIADGVDGVEVGEVVAPSLPELLKFRRRVSRDLGELRAGLEDLDEMRD